MPPIEFKNEKNDIFVRHPHPRLPKNKEQQEKNGNTVSAKGISASNDTISEHFPSTKVISASTEMSSTQSPSTSAFALDNRTNCEARESRNLFWEWTPVETTIMQPCPSDSKGVAKWHCTLQSSQPQWFPKEADLSNCESHWVLLLDEKIREDETKVGIFVNELAEKTKVKTMYGKDIERVTYILSYLINRMEAAIEEIENYQMRNQVVKEILNATQDICNNLLEDSKHNSWLDLNQTQRAVVATHLSEELEKTAELLSKTNTANSNYSRKQSNIYLAVYTRISKDIHEGMELPILSNYNEEPSSSKNNSEMDYLLSSNKVYFPLQTLRRSEKESVVRISFISYSKLGLFLGSNVQEADDLFPGEENVTTIINSNVIGLMLNDKDSFPTNAKVRFTLHHLVKTNVANSKCVFWKAGEFKWSSYGCEVIAWNQTHTTCECNHLTNFAVLMQVRDIKISAANEAALRIITYIGCSVSIICLALTLLIFILCKSLKGDRIAIHTNLCFCLLIGELVFIFGISQTETVILCRIVALILHYIFLSAFLWMFFEGFQLYVMLIEVFESEKPRLPMYYFFSYGIPLVIVAICFSSDPYSYGTLRHCWLRTDNYFVLSFVGPVVAILMANLVFLSLALCVIWKHISTSVISVTKPNKDENKIKSIRFCYLISYSKAFKNQLIRRLWLRGALGLVFLLGMTWTFGVLYLNQETIAMAYLFTIFNSFQGLFIFIFHCFQNEKVRKEYSKVLNSLHLKTNCFASSNENSSAFGSYEKRKNANQLNSTTNSNNQQTSSQSEEPIIAPHSGSSLTPTLRRVATPSGAKHFLTSRIEDTAAIHDSDYGFRNVSEAVQNKQRQRCKTHCEPVLKNGHLEHLYECIDDVPYTPKVFATSACCSCDRDNVNGRSQNEASCECENQMNSNANTKAFRELKLPAIICDNSTVISAKSSCNPIASPKARQKHRDEEKRNMIAKLNGRQVITSAVCNTSADA
ncbi:G-protein coupled receptor protein-like protein [Dinothrombium tinctorium]|uniref:G-protein coupled receptor protein-like protein n=1 Tax=Dinothrombium tinctorium TaxID=1965070 RepID=A0A443RP77_9ACAR|nr:G-protein coupled receptor protein-like protein [Dinothrombium tinctorium]